MVSEEEVNNAIEILKNYCEEQNVAGFAFGGDEILFVYGNPFELTARIKHYAEIFEEQVKERLTNSDEEDDG